MKRATAAGSLSICKLARKRSLSILNKLLVNCQTEPVEGRFRGCSVRMIAPCLLGTPRNGLPPSNKETTMETCSKCGQKGHEEAQCPNSAVGGPPDDALDAVIHGRPFFKRPGVWVVIAAVVLIGGGLTVRSMMGGSSTSAEVATAPATDAGTDSETEEEGQTEAEAKPAQAGKVIAKAAPPNPAKGADKVGGKPSAAPAGATPPSAQAKVAPPPAVGTGPVLVVTVDTQTWKLKSSSWKVPLVDGEQTGTDDKGVHYVTKAGKKYVFAFAKVDWNSPKPQEVALLEE